MPPTCSPTGSGGSATRWAPSQSRFGDALSLRGGNSPVRATVRLTLDCDNACIFCAQTGLERIADPELAMVRAQLSAARAESDELCLLGGEPLLAATLLAAVGAARDLDFSRVGIQTNARRLADGALAHELARAGLTDVHVSVHGARASAHDHHTGRPGSFAELLRGVARARDAGLAVVATTVMTRSGFRGLGDLPQLLASRGVAAWSIVVPRDAGRTRAAPDRILPRLALALPHALHAIEVAGARFRLPAWIAGAPLCLLGPYTRRALPTPPRTFGQPCEGCGLRARCPGVEASYLARFDGDELRPMAEAAPPEEVDALARCFVGVGELAPPALSAPATSPEAPTP